MTGDAPRALILAAGLSSRMKARKALLPFGDQSVLARAVGLFRRAGAREVLVVAGHDPGPVLAEASAAGAAGLVNPDWAAGMWSSVRAGLTALLHGRGPVFVLPADIPLVRPASLAALLAALRESDAPAARPTFRGQPGHPPLLAGTAPPAVLAHDGQDGLAGALAALAGGALDVPVMDEGVLLDMDQPWDYLRLLARFERLGIPTPAECAALLDTLPEAGRVHGRAVAMRAVAMALAVNARRAPAEALNVAAVRAAGLLHDLAKGRPRHEVEGGRMLEALGFSDIAGIVAAHRDPVPAEGRPVNEREVVALADKFVRGGQAMGIEERFGEKLEQWSHDPEAAAAIRRRLANALRVRERIEAEIGQDLDRLFAAAERDERASGPPGLGSAT